MALLSVKCFGPPSSCRGSPAFTFSPVLKLPGLWLVCLMLWVSPFMLATASFYFLLSLYSVCARFFDLTSCAFPVPTYPVITIRITATLPGPFQPLYLPLFPVGLQLPKANQRLLFSLLAVVPNPCATLRHTIRLIKIISCSCWLWKTRMTGKEEERDLRKWGWRGRARPEERSISSTAYSSLMGRQFSVPEVVVETEKRHKIVGKISIFNMIFKIWSWTYAYLWSFWLKKFVCVLLGFDCL